MSRDEANAPTASPNAPEGSDVEGGLARGATLGRYVILKALGGGGMGLVYLAFDNELERRVAVKLLRSEHGRAGSEGPVRLLREAQVMAKLSHPNVLTVFDAGTFEGDVLIAMEYVKGSTLREWWTSSARSPAEIIAMCVQAGRGLAAAHDQGIVHRDFKPENVLVDEQGRARVLDFGLARAVGAQTGESQRFELDDTLVGKRAELSSPLTQHGAVVGTPAYMAPEQMHGAPIDPRGDQFAFCVVVYEALFGQRPFAGSTLEVVAQAIAEGAIRPLPKGSRVPRAVLPILERGLASKPEARWRSMTALLDALERAGKSDGRRTGVLLGVLGVTVAGAIAAAALLGTARAPTCSGADQPLAGVWDHRAREAVMGAFRASGNANAEAALARVVKVLDDYATAWGAMSQEACVATRVRGVQSDEALDLRTGCLQARLEDVRATTALLRHADVALVNNAVGAVLRLRPLAACADVRALRAAYEPIGDAEKQRAVATAKRDVADVVARYNAGRCEEAMPLARRVAEHVGKVGYRPIEAEALYWRARTEHVCGDPKAAAEALFVAVADAQESHQDELLARILTELAAVQGTELARYDEAEDFARVAAATIWRVGAPEALLSELAHARGWIEYTRGDSVAALPLRKEALARHQHALGDDDPDAVQLRAELGDLEYESGQLTEALADEHEVLTRSIQLLGPRHLRTGRYTLDVAETLIAQGKYAEASPFIDQARPLVSASVSEHERFVEGIEAIGLGDVEGGRARLEACARAADERYGKDDPYPISIRADLAERLTLHRRNADALEMARDVVRHIEATKGIDNPWFPNAFASLALLLARTGHAEEAIGPADHAIALSEKGAAQQLPFALLAKGEALVARGANAEAAAPLERALTMVAARGGIDGIALGDLRFALARATASGDPPRSKQLADDARSAYLATKEPAFAAAVDIWAAARR